jgi:hypothetical protein
MGRGGLAFVALLTGCGGASGVPVTAVSQEASGAPPIAAMVGGIGDATYVAFRTPE